MFFDLSFNPMEPNAFAIYVMQSEEYRDQIIDLARKYYYEEGLDMEDSIKAAMYELNVNPDDLTIEDREEVISLIKEEI